MRNVLMILGAVLALYGVLVVLGRRAHRERELSAAALSGPALADPAADAPVQQRILALIQQRKRIEAIKLVRDHSGASLADAKRLVENLAAGGSPPPWFGALDQRGATDTVRVEVDDELRDRLRELMGRRKKIEAIKLLRNRTGWRLAEAKRYVERL